MAAALFMDIKWLFDYVSKVQLICQILELGINRDLLIWTELFLTVQKVQLVINGYNNQERKIETEIPQSFPVSPILFLIYIGEVMNKILETSLLVTSLSFIDDLSFIASDNSVKEIIRVQRKFIKEVIKWGRQNAVTYNTSKIEAVHFSKSYWQ